MSPLLPLPETHIHPQPLQTLAPHLTPHLPHSLPLLRRLQYHHSSPHARTLATFPPSQQVPTSTPPPSSSSSSSSWSALWIDRSRGPETECWIFSTHELPSSYHRNDDAADLARAELIALFYAVAQLPVVPSNNRPPGAGDSAIVVVGSLRESLVDLLGGDHLKYLRPQTVLSRDRADDVPTRNDTAAEEDEDEGEGDGNDGKMKGEGRGVLAAISTPYMKWIIAPPPPPPAMKEQQQQQQQQEEEENGEKREPDKELELPPGYHYSRPSAQRGELKLVLSRTDIPRSEATLKKLGSVGIRYIPPSSFSIERHGKGEKKEDEDDNEQERVKYDDDDDDDDDRNSPTGDLISWSFLGTDGSLTSLHVEPAHRGKGLAKAVAKRLFKAIRDGRGRAEMGFRTVVGDGDGDGGWAHSDVAIENKGSAGVARGLGGVEGWVVRWVYVDLGRVRGVVREEFDRGGRGGGINSWLAGGF